MIIPGISPGRFFFITLFFLSFSTWCWAPPPAGAMDNDDCISCHGEETPVVDYLLFEETVHGDLDCTDCHEDIFDIPHEGEIEVVVCANCHDEEGELYDEGVHGIGLSEDVGDVPVCQTCHGQHNIFPPSDPRSQIYPLNVVEICGMCHSDELVAEEHSISVPDPYQKYLTSSHGKGLIQSGLLVSAVCNDCHGSHKILPQTDPDSKIHRDNIIATCGECHAGIQMQFEESVHGLLLKAGTDGGPTCTTCHSSHNISRVTEDEWKLHIIEDCGHCHEELIEAYRETYHGQVTALGYSKPARCSDCHGSHDILSPEDPESTLSPANLVQTCQKCHPKANDKFALYYAHADHNDPDNYPFLFFTYWGMVSLLFMTFSFFGVHTLLWLIRSLKEKHRRPPIRITDEPMYMRFGLYERSLHFMVIISFLTLVLTGMPLKFSETGWAQFLAPYLGGFETAGFFHRLAAVITFGYLFLHLAKILRRFVRGEKGLFWGPDSMVPNLKDAADLTGHMKWFLGLGERPKFDRYTYWEKFDYWAVFWGVTMIGVSGLFLWFPTFFSKLFPGWAFNIAQIIHSDEALLAAGFIFFIHFFNCHLRPEKFPMDYVIFTGRMSLEELEHERPEEYARMKESGELERRLAEPAQEWQYNASRIFGFTAVAIGLSVLFILIMTMF